MSEPMLLPPETAREPFWDWHDAALFVGLAVPCTLLSMGLSHGAFWLFGRPAVDAIRLFTVQFLAYLLWFTALWLLLKIKYDRPFWRSLGWNVPWSGMAWTVVLGPAVAFTVAVLGVALKTPLVDNPIQKMMTDRSAVVLVGFFAATLGPLAEELIFRGFLLPLVARTTGGLLAVALTNLPFVLLHGPQYGWTWQHLMLLFLASSVFGLTKLKTGSTAASTLVHAGYNATFFSAMLLQGPLPG
jgi:hypothetical protein